jgi:Beta-lactamase enzyme family
MRINPLLFCSLLIIWSACKSPKNLVKPSNDTLGTILSSWSAQDSLAARVLADPDYEVQIIYTQIDRDAKGNPSFRSYRHNVDSARYFYPASMVKMPLALLALEKINLLRKSGYPRLTRETPYRLDSLRAFQQNYAIDSTAPGFKPSIAHDVRQIFVVSDNLAYNHLFEFLGRDEINRSLRQKGYEQTGIVHRFNFSRRDNSYSSPIAFYEPTAGVWKQGEKKSEVKWENPQHSCVKGKAYYRGDSLIRKPFDMKTRNWFALTDMEKMLKAVIFPKSMPEKNRFDLSKSDYEFLYRYMGIFPRECDYPKYKAQENYDGYVKFFLFGDNKDRQSGRVRVFNKVGEAYGTLTDVAYIVDFDNKVEFMLSATILCNKDGIFNDDSYDYDRVGFPFLAALGRKVYAHELSRKRPNPPNLSVFENAVK